jgi:hypothetical protein
MHVNIQLLKKKWQHLLCLFHTSRLTQSIINVTDEQGQISGGGRAELQQQMPGWPTGGGNHWLPYAAAAAASSGFPPAPELGCGLGAEQLNHHRPDRREQQWR